jgi:general secretion pathway protein D
MVAERLKLNLEYDPASLTGSINIRTEGGLSDQELWQLFNGVLATRGLTTVLDPAQRTYRIVKVADATSVAPIQSSTRLGAADPDQPGAPGAGFVTVVLRTVHRPAKDLVEPLSKVISKPSGSVTALGSAGGIASGPGAAGTRAGEPDSGSGVGGVGGLLLVSDLASRVDQAIALLAILDTPSEGVVVVEVPVVNVSAEQMAVTFAQVVAKRDAIAGQVAGQTGGQVGSEKSRGDILPGPDGNSVLLVSPPSEVERWRALINSLDRRERIDTITYTPRHYAVRDVAPLIEQTVKNAADDRWKLVIDELTGSLLITATPSQHASVQTLLDRLDDAPAAARRPVRTFVIKNRSVMEIQSILENLLRSGVLDAASSGDITNAQDTDAGGASQPTGVGVMAMPPVPSDDRSRSGIATASDVANASTSSGSRRADLASRRVSQDRSGSVLQGPPGGPVIEDRPLILSSDEGTNTLIAVGEPRLLAQVESLLVSLDVRQPQVMLEVLIVTLTESQTLDLGVELEYLRIDGETKSRIASLFGLSQRGTDGNPSTGSATGLSGVVINPGDFSVVLRALETMNNGRAFSMPRLLVGNNQQASLDSVVQQPFASVNASNTVSTTSFGGTQDAGTTVTIKPQIAEGDHLVLDYSVSLSSFLGAASQPTLPPARQQNRVSSAATIPDGFTVVVGGIELEDKGKTVSQVPFLGNVPIIGEAFKSRGKNASRTRFYVFIRANILRGRGFEDLKYISTQDIAKAGLDPGWPTSKPRVIR